MSLSTLSVTSWMRTPHRQYTSQVNKSNWHTSGSTLLSIEFSITSTHLAYPLGAHNTCLAPSDGKWQCILCPSTEANEFYRT